MQALLESGVDYILLPNAVDAETPFMQAESKLCPWNQTLPFVVRAVQKLERRLDGKLLCPTIHFRQGQQLVRVELRRLADQLGLRKTTSDLAMAEAYRAQGEFAEMCNARASSAANIESEGRAGSRGAGPALQHLRPRHVLRHTPQTAHAVRHNILPLDFLPLDGEDVSQINDNMYWHSGRLILRGGPIRTDQSQPSLDLYFQLQMWPGFLSQVIHRGGQRKTQSWCCSLTDIQ